MINVGPDRGIYVGLDLGKEENHSAIVVLERFEQMPTDFADVLRGVAIKIRYIVRYVERLALGTPYTEVVARLRRMIPQLEMWGTVVLVVDESGVGVPVVEMLREVRIGCAVMPMVITSGQQSTARTVPRAELITKMQLMALRG